MTNFDNFPNPPYMNQNQGGFYNNQYQYQQPFQQPMYVQQVQTPSGNVQVETYAPGTNPESTQQDQPHKVSLGASFGSLIGTNVTVSSPMNSVVTETTPAVQKKSTVSTKNKKKDDKPVDSKTIVENTVYADTYEDTNMMTYGIIAQADELLTEAKRELDTIRTSRTMKGKYMYMTKMMDSMASLFNTKMQAIKEINSNIKAANDAEYRRFKDNRALSNEDDNKLIMDAYKAFISAPVGAPAYSQPNTLQITGMQGVVPARPEDNQTNQDSGLQNYLSRLSPEENRMINENNPNIEEVIEYDDMTGVKRFKWIDKRTNQEVPNMPKGSDLILEDYVYDPRTGLAKNTKLNTVKKVIHVNSAKFNQY